jgi:hypothetical protein
MRYSIDLYRVHDPSEMEGVSCSLRLEYSQSSRIVREDAANQRELASDSAPGAAELAGDGVSREPLHAEDRDPFQDVVAQALEKARRL